MIKELFLVTIIVLSSATILAQNCSCISTSKNKKTGIISKGGVTSSEDHYSLMVQKIVSTKDSTVPVKFKLFLHAASRVLFTDSMLSTKGAFILTMDDDATLTIDSVEFYNNPLKMGPALGFVAYLLPQQLQLLSKHPIKKIVVAGILETGFGSASRSKQMKIFPCLLKQH